MLPNHALLDQGGACGSAPAVSAAALPWRPARRTAGQSAGGPDPTGSFGSQDCSAGLSSSRPDCPRRGHRVNGGPAGRRMRSAAPTIEYARHGRSIGGESPLEEEVVLTPSRRQLRRREAGWEGSPRRNPAPRNTNRVEGGAIWVSLLKKAKPVTINRVVT